MCSLKDLKQTSPIGYQIIIISYISQQQIEQLPQATYLSVTIDEHLKWTNHVDKIVAKANPTISFLQRNLSSYNPSVNKDCYLTMVRPISEYACSAWSPYTQVNINKLEMVQHHAARFITGNYSYQESVTATLAKLNLPSLAQR